MNWIALFIARPVLTWMLTLALFVFGVLGLMRLDIDAFPELEFPEILVSAELEGAPPEVIEQNITDVLEEYLNTIEGVKRIASRSQLGRATIGVEFELGTNLDRAAEEVRDRVNRARRQLPDDMDQPRVSKLDFSGQPILFAPLFTQRSAVESTEFVDDFVKPKIETIKGVAGVDVFGQLQREIRIWLDGGALRARGLSATDITAALRREHVEKPGGIVEGGAVEYAVRTDAEYQSLEALSNMVIAYQDGAAVRLRDVARVEDGAADRRFYARFDGKPGMGLEVVKSTDGNAVSVAEQVKQRIAALSQVLPADLQFAKAEGIMDLTSSIKESVAEANFALWFGALLATLVVFVFLRRVRPTLVVALAIPLSLVTSFGVMWVFGFTLNTMTILALTLAVGVVIDDAIVVLENIERHRERGEAPHEAAFKGAREVAFAATSATIAIAAVFLPVVFADGIVSGFLGEFGATVASAVMVSLVVALTLTPMLAARIPTAKRQSGGQSNALYNLLDNALHKLESQYKLMLHWALSHRKSTLGIATLSFVIGVIMASGLGREFFPSGDQGYIFVGVEAAPGTSPEGTLALMKRNEQWALKQGEVASLYSASGYAGAFYGGENASRGSMMLMLTPRDQRTRSAQDLIDSARAELGEIPGQKLRLSDMSGFGGGSDRAQFEVELRGSLPLEELDFLADQFINALAAHEKGAFVDLDKNLKLGRPELRVVPDREKAAALGVDSAQLSAIVRAMIGGIEIGNFKEGGKRHDIRMRLERENRDSPAEILDLYARTRGGEVVELRNLVQLKTVAAPQTITRVDRQRAVRISANLNELDPGAAYQFTQEIARELLPEGVILAPTGGVEEMLKSFGQLFFMQGLAILLIYMILAAQFESMVHPLTVMLALPLAMVGAFGGLAISGNTLNVFSMIGIILLFGLVTKNSILLVDYTNQLRARGLNKYDAVAQAAPVRLRPVLMTALSMIFGVAPAALGWGPGSESRAPMAIAAGAGMFSSTLLTLLVVPVFYLVLDDGLEKLRALFRRQKPTAQSGGAVQ